MTLEGVVSQVDWRNPHVHVFLNVTDRDGRAVSWAVHPHVNVARESTPGIVRQATLSPEVTAALNYHLDGPQQFKAYFQDDWRVLPRLTVDVGVRYDLDLNLYDQKTNDRNLTYQVLRAIGHPYARALPQTPTKDIGPRVGFAYDVGGNVWDLLSPETRAGGGFNWLREGVRIADAVTTVSPTYAMEISTPLGGHGLDGVLRARGDAVVGLRRQGQHDAVVVAGGDDLAGEVQADGVAQEVAALARHDVVVAGGRARVLVKDYDTEGLDPAVYDIRRDENGDEYMLTDRSP